MFQNLNTMEITMTKKNEDKNKKNRHGNILTVDQIIKLEDARLGLYKKLKKPGCLKTLRGNEAQLSQYLGLSDSEVLKNGILNDTLNQDDVIYNYLSDSKQFARGYNKRNNVETECISTSNIGNIISVKNGYENGFTHVNSELSFISPPRYATLERMENGEYNLILRNATVLRRGTGSASKLERLTLVESGSASLPSEFLPGDHLVEVNNINVEDLSSSDIWEIINKSENKVRLKVKPIPELHELSLRSGINGGQVSVKDQCIKTGSLKRTGSMRYLHGKENNKKQSGDNINDRISGTPVWLVHKGGITSVVVVGNSPDDPIKCIVRLEHSDTEIEVNKNDVERANPASYDRIEDISLLPFLNESSILNTLEQRFNVNLTHTCAGQVLTVFNPMQSLSVYSNKVIALFRGCRTEDMPPHIYATAQAAYRDMMDTRQNQGIVLMGLSGSGKTTNLKHILHYYTSVTKSKDNIITANKINASFVLLEAFGNSRTIQNSSATRFAQVTSVNFDRGGVITDITIQATMLERTRIFRRPEGEPTFHIFYQLLSGLDNNLRRELFLENLTDPNLFVTAHKIPYLQQKAAPTWNKIYQAMCTVQFAQNEIKAICSVLAAIYHLGIAGCMKSTNEVSYQFARPTAARRAAVILGLTLAELSDIIFNHQHQSPSSGHVNVVDLLEDFVVSLYTELFQIVIHLVNRSFSSKRQGDYSIILFDSAGFQNPALCGRLTGSSFEDLCFNYLQERLQILFKDTLVNSRIDLFQKENIDCDLTNISSNSFSPTICHIDENKPKVGLNIKQNSSISSALFPFLDEVWRRSSATDETFRLTVVNHYKSVDNEWIKSGRDDHTLLVNHMHGGSSILYDIRSWMKSTRMMDHCAKAVHNCLVQSNRQEIKNLLNMTRNKADARSNSFCQQLISNVDAVIEMLKQTKLRFVLCLSPRHDAGFHDFSARTSQNISPTRTPIVDADEVFFDEPIVRAQIRGYELSNVAFLYRQGFPDNMLFEEFSRLYGILVPPELLKATDDIRETVQQILDYMKVDKDSYQLGLTQVFFRAGALSTLNDEKDEKINTWMEKLQTVCQGCLARKKLQKLQFQTSSIKCIQNNVRIMASIKGWSWWKLFSNVRPLVHINLLEQEKKMKTLEMDELKKKLEKIEREKNDLKEAVSQMGTTKVRRKCDDDEDDADFDDVTDHVSWRNSHQYNSTLNSEGEEDDDNIDLSYQEKYDNARHQGDLEKRKLQRIHEDEIEDLLSSKKLMEKKLSHAIEDVEAQQSLLDSVTKKTLQYSKDISDLKNHLEEQKHENEELEIKRKINDSEIQRLNDLLKAERMHKDKLQQEKDKIEKEKYSTELQLQDFVANLELEADKRKTLEEELQYLSNSVKDNKEVVQLRKLKTELEQRCQKQEEELNKQESIIQHLEMAKLQVEATHDKLRQQQTRMQREKDEELEELRKMLQRKIHGVELQLEEEVTQNERLQKEKAEIDKKLQQMVEPNKSIELKLRKKLKHMKRLLHDSRHLSEMPTATMSKVMKQLKMELEEAEMATSAAKKAKKAMDLELTELIAQMEIIKRNKEEADERCKKVSLSQAELQGKLDEAGDDYEDLLKKYKALVQQNSLELTQIQEQSQEIEDLLNQLEKKKEETESLKSRIHYQQSTSVSKQIVSRLEAKINELEAVVEMEQTNKNNAETRLSRFKAQLEKEMSLRQQMEAEYSNALALNKKLEKQIKELKEQLRDTQKRESDISLQNKQLEKKMQNYELECEQYNEELQLTNKRLAELKKALENDHLGFIEHDDANDAAYDNEEYDDDPDELLGWSSVSYNSIVLSPKRSIEGCSDA